MGGDGGSGMRGSSGGGKREFLKTALEKHPLWRDESFWHQALQVSSVSYTSGWVLL